MTVTTDQTQTRSPAQRPDLTFGVDRYFEFLQREVTLTRQLTVTWAAAVAALSAAVLAQTRAVRSIATERAERTLSSWVERTPLEHPGAARRRTQREAEPDPEDVPAGQVPITTDIFDEVIELLVVDDIFTATTEQAAAR